MAKSGGKASKTGKNQDKMMFAQNEPFEAQRIIIHLGLVQSQLGDISDSEEYSCSAEQVEMAYFVPAMQVFNLNLEEGADAFLC